jgi:hypothetical protein
VWTLVLAALAFAWGGFSLWMGLTGRTMSIGLRAVVTAAMMPIVALALWATGGEDSFLEPVLLFTALFIGYFFEARYAWPLLGLFIATYAAPLVYDSSSTSVSYPSRTLTFAVSVVGAAMAVQFLKHAFALSWPATLRGAWLVLRANQLWAPYPDNDPDGARRCMRGFYALVARRHGETFDVTEAARLEVEWWRIHRYLQRDDPTADEGALAMRQSDRWVQEGSHMASPLIPLERAALVRSYSALLAAVHR